MGSISKRRMMPRLQPSHTPTVTMARRERVTQEKKLISVGEISLEKFFILVLIGSWRCEKQASDGENIINIGTEKQQGGMGICGGRGKGG